MGLIALGVICVLLLGEIDLSIGSMSGLASAIMGILWINTGLPLPLAMLGAVATGAVTGLVYGVLRNRFEMPSFIATLAGLLALLGVQLYILGPSGSINLPFDSALVRFGQLLIIPAWLSYTFALIPGLVMVWGDFATRKRRNEANLSSTSPSVALLKSVSITAALVFAVYYLERGRGVPWMFAVFVLCRSDDELRIHPHKMGPVAVRRWWERRGRTPVGDQCAANPAVSVCALLGVCSTRRRFFGGAASLV